MRAPSLRAALLGLTALTALAAVPALAQTQRVATPGTTQGATTQGAAPAPGAADPLNTAGRPDGTPGNPPGTALGRAADRAGDAASRANERVGDPLNLQGRPDGTPGNPPGTVATRALDRAAGTDVSGANPGAGTAPAAGQTTAQSPAQPPAQPTVSDRGAGTSAGAAPAVGANLGAMGSSQPGAAPSDADAARAQAREGGQVQPGPVNTAPDGGQVRAGTLNVPLQNQAHGTAGSVIGERASRIIGSNVHNERNESVGTVDDLLLDAQGGPATAVVSVGGFLGIGAKLVTVPFGELRWNAADSRWILPGATRDSLTSRPAYSYAESRRG